ncbi:MAG: ABC transporter substrate-binding protein [Oscillospiraceae bacterium]|nr:ABC transporter substrate-binding protein [Oscillospiraceae bacterium]MDD4369032.1 ABC transporter substrate-binding protein [Oscillospiraceae bacterium]
MKRFTKILSAGLAASLTLVLASCGSSASSATTTAGSNTSGSAEASSSAAGSAGEVTTLKWVTVGSGQPTNYDAWAEQVNAYLGEKAGINVDVEVVSWGDWDNRRNVIVNTGGDFDILFTNGGTFNNDVQTGAFTDITDLVQSQTPELYQMIPEEYWEACQIDGKIYAVPTYKDSSQSEFIVWDEQLAKDNGIDPSQYTELDQLTEPLTTLLNATGEASFPLSASSLPDYLTFMYDQMNTGLSAIGVRYDDQDAEVVSVYEQQDVMDSLKLMHQWFETGIINADAATKTEGDDYKAVSIAQGWAGAAQTTWGPGMGVDAVAYQWGPTIVSNDTVRGSLNCISANSANPDKALELLQYVNTDTYVRDLFYYGVQGDNWDYTDDTQTKVHKNNSDWTMAGYTQGTFFNVTQTDDVDFNQWDEVKELNEQATPSVLLGFTFDASNVSDQLANCISIVTRYKSELLTGTVDPETEVPALMDELRAAGFDDIVTEAQTQVDAFMAGK